jgi:tRNA threonylcarbamoyladenosine biosynthesis protein TsaE
MKLLSDSVERTIELGRKIGTRLSGGEFITLIGDLGGGKTHFTKGVAKGLGILEEITSPTFVIERIYESPKKLMLHHFDFYRLGNFDKEVVADIKDLLEDKNNVVIVEWAKNIPDALPDELLQVDFEYAGDDSRNISLTPSGKTYEKLIKDLK